MVALVLDECISPSLCPRLWAEGIDNFHVRDRGLLGVSDAKLWMIAQAQERAIVTINADDFWRLSSNCHPHYGVVVIPSGGTRNTQFDYVMSGVRWAANGHAILPPLKGQFIEVRDDFLISVRGVPSSASNHLIQETKGVS